MPNRVREILLVSSDYDAFVMEEDGRLGERVYTRYSELSLSQPPRITHATTAAQAIRLLDTRPFDLVMTVVQLEDVGVNAFGRMVKELFPKVPVVLLLFGETDLERCGGGVDEGAVDRVVLWTGDPQVLVCAIKLIEDAANVEHDCREGDVQVIIVVEDSVRDYSRLLSLLFAEVVTQSRLLIADGLNDMHTFARMRARPKVLHARTYEAALAMCEAHRDNLLALVTDVRFPLGGQLVGDAGLLLVEKLRQMRPELPVLVQSSERRDEAWIEAARVTWLDKAANELPRRIRGFLEETLGFGPFVFRLSDRTEVGRAADIAAMERAVELAPAESIDFHARRHDFSRWLKARCMFDLAASLRPQQVADFADVESVRGYLVEALRAAQRHLQDALITDFDGHPSHQHAPFIRLGGGSTGGKGRGIAFLHQLISRHQLGKRFPGLRVCAPRTAVIGTEAYSQFMANDPPAPGLLAEGSDGEVLDAFLQRPLPEAVARDLRVAARDFRGPLAVRSSSLLEDSRFQSFAGIYTTWMLPNDHPDPEVRHQELCQTVKAIYSSIWMANARNFFRGTPASADSEKMAVVIQRLIGRRWRDRFYPHLAGVAQSRNYYPLEPQRADDGIVLLALGLGHIVVGGGAVLRFSPRCPQVLPQFASASDIASNTQAEFCALDLAHPTIDFRAGCSSNLGLFDLAVAERDGSLQHVGSVYCQADDVIRDDLRSPGPRVVAFSDILKYGTLPLAEALAEVLPLLRHAMGGEVELEFAMDLEAAGGPELHLLQVRHMLSASEASGGPNLATLPAERVLLRTNTALGHGTINDIQDVVYVTTATPDAYSTPAIARAVGRLTQDLRDAERPFLLIGPGRWGTADPALGVPVEWAEIAGARAIIETPFRGRDVAPSQGTHFFQNVTQRQIGYLTLTSRDLAEEGGDRPRLVRWLDGRAAVAELDSVRHVRLAAPLIVALDGLQGAAAILRGLAAPPA